MQNKKQSILQRAHAIVHERAEESVRQYGPFTESMEKTAQVASVMSNKQLTAQDVFNVFIAQKLVRESYGHKEDNLLDAAAYMSALNDHRNDQTTQKGKRAKKAQRQGG